MEVRRRDSDRKQEDLRTKSTSREVLIRVNLVVWENVAAEDCSEEKNDCPKRTWAGRGRQWRLWLRFDLGEDSLAQQAQ